MRNEGENMIGPSQIGLEQMIQGLRRGTLSSQELTRAYLERIERIEPRLHAFITLTADQALSQAAQADRQLEAWRKEPTGELPSLLGVPIAVKDVLCVKNVRCTCGSRILENFKPVFNATVVERLLAAGVVVLGKTNTDEFAMGSSTENSAYGPTHNPWDLERAPGGSSGGSAAAIAAGLAPLALGTDTGGSVRQPASFCGVTGIKPTYGRVSRYGLVAYGSSLDTVGVLGRNAAEIAQVFAIMAGPDALDATSMEAPEFEKSLLQSSLELSPRQALSGVRVGVPHEYFISGIQPEVEERVRQAIAVLEEFGAQLIPVSLPHTEYALPVYYLIAPAEASANLARYDGVRYGPRLPADAMWEVFFKTRGNKFGAEVKRRIMLGTYALSAGYYDAYYGQAQKARTLIKQDFERAFEQVDVIAAPVSPSTAFRLGEHTNDPLAMYLEDVFTLPANLAGVPGITFPVGFDQLGLPVGLQLMGAQYHEDLLFRIAHAYQQITDWHTRYPEL
jgi:aspartyl-tRNA(Asn)/glutamyl-tRNA(Gln) amidotransferase subunit A